MEPSLELNTAIQFETDQRQAKIELQRDVDELRRLGKGHVDPDFTGR
jgi:hypothetical protein